MFLIGTPRLKSAAAPGKHREHRRSEISDFDSGTEITKELESQGSSTLPEELPLAVREGVTEHLRKRSRKSAKLP